MIFTCDKYLLLAAILTATRATATKSAVPLLEGLMIEADDDTVRITGYDLKTGIITNVPSQVDEPGGIVLNARLFGDIVRKAPGGHIKISTNPRYIAKISSEVSEFEILGSPTSDYPELPTMDIVDNISISESTLKRMILQTNFAVSDNESRPIHTGALFEVSDNELTVVAVDGFRLALCREPLEYSGEQELSFVVPGAALSEVEKVATDSDDLVTISLGTKHIQFTIGDTMLISRRLEGEFLNYRSSIPQSSKYQFIIDKGDIISSVERVSLILNEKVKGPVRCVFGNEVIKLSSTSTYGKASDECAMMGNGDDIEIGFNDRYFIEALRAAPTNDIKFELSSGIAPCVISPADESNSFLFLILPVRLKAYET